MVHPETPEISEISERPGKKPTAERSTANKAPRRQLAAEAARKAANRRVVFKRSDEGSYVIGRTPTSVPHELDFDDSSLRSVEIEAWDLRRRTDVCLTKGVRTDGEEVRILVCFSGEEGEAEKRFNVSIAAAVTAFGKQVAEVLRSPDFEEMTSDQASRLSLTESMGDEEDYKECPRETRLVSGPRLAI